MKSEHLIQQAILMAVGSLSEVRIWRQNTGQAMSFDGKRIVKFGLPGCADISGILADGRRLEIEVKAPGGRQTDQQKAFERMMRKYNGVYILVHSVEEAMAGIQAALAGERHTVG